MNTDNPNTVDFLRYIVERLVSNKDAIQIKRTVDEMGVLLLLYVDPSDRGKIIGKRGAIAKAIRTLLRAAGMQNHERVTLKILEDHERGELEGNATSQEPAPSMSAPADSVDDIINELKEEE